MQLNLPKTTYSTFFCDVKHLHTSSPLESNGKTMKSASGKRPPDEAHVPGKEAIRPQQRCLGKSRFWHRSAFKNMAKVRQTFSHVCSFILNCHETTDRFQKEFQSCLIARFRAAPKRNAQALKNQTPPGCHGRRPLFPEPEVAMPRTILAS